MDRSLTRVETQVATRMERRSKPVAVPVTSAVMWQRRRWAEVAV